MSVVIWGAGSVGLVLGARLASAGERVLFVCRNRESAAAITDQGVRFDDVAAQEGFTVPASALVADEISGEQLAGMPILLCVRTAHTSDAARQIAGVAASNPVVCVQNGLAGATKVGRQCQRVAAAVYRQTCTRTAPNAVVSVGAGRIVVGALRESEQHAVDAIAVRLRVAGYDVGVSERIHEDQLLKLCVNLMSAPNALIRREDHATAEFVEIKTALLREAQRALHSSGRVARSCDGRDRSLDAEIEFQRDALARGDSARPLPVYNPVWKALREGGPVEADEYHRTIIELAREHGVETPMNRRVLAALERAVRDSRGPESTTAQEILALD